jgi:hypothetical protein
MNIRLSAAAPAAVSLAVVAAGCAEDEPIDRDASRSNLDGVALHGRGGTGPEQLKSHPDSHRAVVPADAFVILEVWPSAQARRVDRLHSPR